MPFAIWRTMSKQNSYCDEMTKEIVGAIGKVRHLTVLAPVLVLRLQRQHETAQDRDTMKPITCGSIRRRQPDADRRWGSSTRTVLASGPTTTTAPISDIFDSNEDVQDEVANHWYRALPDGYWRTATPPHTNPKASDLYMQARVLWQPCARR